MNYFSYFSEIEETFIRRRGKNLLLSPLDWALIETWQEREVPLHIVLRGIEKVFDNHEKSKKKRTIKSLAFCSEEIEVQYEEWLESQVGKNNGENIESNQEDSMFSQQTMAQHLENISSKMKAIKTNLNNELQEILDRILHRLDELKNGISTAEKLEDDLTNLEKIIDEYFLENAEKPEFANLKAEVENQLKGYKNQMETEVYQRTFDLMLLKRMRENTEIPRLSLFYL